MILSFAVTADRKRFKRRPQKRVNGNGAIERRFYFRGTTLLPVAFEVWDVPPGAGEGVHARSNDRPSEDIYYCIDGRGEMLVDGEGIPLAAGDAVLAPPGGEHGLRNTGKKPMKLVVVWGKPLSRVGSVDGVGAAPPP